MNTCDPHQHEQHLCRLYETQAHKKDPAQYAHLVNDPKFVCKSCGRVAGARENLCHPVLLGTWEE